MKKQEMMEMAKTIAGAYNNYIDAPAKKTEFYRGIYRGMIKACRVLGMDVFVADDLASQSLTVTIENGSDKVEYVD